MMRSCVIPCALLALVATSQVACGATKLRAILTNDEEPCCVVPSSSNGGPRPQSYGVAIFELNDAQTAMTMTARIFHLDFGGQTPLELNDNITAAHIHGNDAADPATRPVVWGFLGLPDHDTNPDDLVVLPFANIAGGIVRSKWDAPEGNGELGGNITRILNGQTYLNFHSAQFTGGEIRGDLLIIPEPATFLLLAGFALIRLSFRRRGWSAELQ